MKRSANFILSLLLIALIAVSAAGCNDNPVVNTDSAETSEIIPQDIGQGETAFRFEVIHSFESTTVWNVHTNEITIGAALFEAGITDNEEFVTYVNGVRADFMEDGYWWAFYIDGEMAVTGVGGTNIEEGVVYAFIHTSA
ncbi:MAG: DUF4430 domain-containing protein [Oscillospiraceae bacterium]|jgi:hypothetical protein|nr:DUF4430 domain-containing protein [Oscillospiraceae bacterium]